MASGKADYTVEVVGDSGQADMTVAIIDDQVIDVGGAANGDFIVSTGSGWETRPLVDADIPASITRDSEAAAAYQPKDATLTGIAGVSTAADKLIYATGVDAFAAADLTAAGRALLDDANAAAQLVTLGAVPLAGGTMSGELVVPDVKVTGKTGATAQPQILAGGTAGGPPTTGAHVAGEVVDDALGFRWYCKTAGTPGDWVCTSSGREIGYVETTADETVASGVLTDFATPLSVVVPSLPVPFYLMLHCPRAFVDAATGAAILTIINNDDSSFQFSQYDQTATASEGGPLTVIWRRAASDSGHTFTAKKSRSTTGTATFKASANSRMFLAAWTR